jgi:hypothetical protein
MRGAPHTIVTKIISHKRFDISAASKFAFFKLAEEFYIKTAQRAQIPLCYSCRPDVVDTM